MRFNFYFVESISQNRLTFAFTPRRFSLRALCTAGFAYGRLVYNALTRKQDVCSSQHVTVTAHLRHRGRYSNIIKTLSVLSPTLSYPTRIGTDDNNTYVPRYEWLHTRIPRSVRAIKPYLRGTHDSSSRHNIIITIILTTTTTTTTIREE